MCDTPTTKSYSGDYWTLITYLEDDGLGLGDKRGAFELTPSHNLGFDDAFLLPDHGLGEVVLLEDRKLWLVGAISDLVDYLLLLLHLVLG